MSSVTGSQVEFRRLARPQLKVHEEAWYELIMTWLSLMDPFSNPRAEGASQAERVSRIRSLLDNVKLKKVTSRYYKILK